ncbi:hypothetical protein K4F52_006091 [Lecanicillium sp. MT-2017a]|nr:hypothetical protein K4F52_006091 [Lecanicillium sp. MT-2017a]
MTAKRFREPTILGEAQRVLLIQQRTDAGDDPTPGGGQTGITKETGTRGSAAETSSAGSGSVGNSNGGSQGSTTSQDGGGGGGGLSTNGKIAIGVTIPIVAILAGLGVLLFFLIRKKRRSRNVMSQAQMTEPKPVPPMMPGPSGTAYDRAELVGTEGRPFAELQGYNPNGMPGAYPYNTPELYGHHAQHELPPATMYETTAELPSNYRGP